MCDKTLKIPGFTLLEMILAMIISAIIISLIFGIFLTLQHTWQSFHKQQEKITMLLLLKKTLDNDIDDAKIIRTVDEKKYVLYSIHDTIQYIFDTTVIRNIKEHSDTFQISVANIKPHYIESLASYGIVAELSFDIIAPVSLRSVVFYKHYTSGDLLTLSINNLY